MSIYRTSGKNTEIYEEYELYTREYVENVGGKSNFTAKEGTVYGDKPKTAKPLELTNLYVKVRLADDYNGEFGFDWIDINRETKEIEKIQDVPFSEVEYFYKKDPADPLGGNIVEKSADEIGAKHAIQDHYKFNPISKHIDIPYALIKLGQEITLSAEIMLWQGEINGDEISIAGDEFYEFNILDGDKEGKIAKKKLTEAGKLKFTIKCLKESPQKIYDFKHTNPVTGTHLVGGITMMENKELKLTFRVIALVSSDGNPNEKAKALFKQFNDANVNEYLNKNSLNQAGYKIEIENVKALSDLDTSDLDDYFYAFNKEDWNKRSLFGTIIKQKEDVDPLTGNCKIGSWDSVKNKCNKIPVETDVLVDDKKDLGGANVNSELNEIDNTTIEEYKEKLKKKGKFYNKGFIILADFESSDENVVAYSRTQPLNHYALIVYSNSKKTSTYAHEIGHMLGLPHLFYTEQEKEAYKNAREALLGNGLSKKNNDGTDNKKYRGGILNTIEETKKSNSDYGSYKGIIAIKEDIIFSLDNLIKSRKAISREYADEKERITKVYINYPDSFKINTKQTKKEGIEICDNWVNFAERSIRENNLAKQDLVGKNDKEYVTLKLAGNFLKNDYLKLLNQYLVYSNMVIDQVHSNYLLYKQKKTKNLMDYSNERLFFMHNQIKIMRSDIQNFLPKQCEFCKPVNSKIKQVKK